MALKGIGCGLDVYSSEQETVAASCEDGSRSLGSRTDLRFIQ